jgi:Ca2+-binding RTX toxin-like protein
MANMTANEQLLLELTNRARMDPAGEAARYGISLNKELLAGSISTTPKQVLAGNDRIAFAADAHSAWMLANDIFNHEEPLRSKSFYGTNHITRMQHAGYSFTGAWANGENISWMGASGRFDTSAAIYDQHRTLFLSSHHRLNILNELYREAGIGQQVGVFSYNGASYNASMITEDFAKSGTAVFITGVVYDDIIHNNNFFDVGEERIRIGVSAARATSDTTGLGGGYELAFAAAGSKTVSFNIPTTGVVSVAVNLPTHNVKVDVVNGHEIWTNATVKALTTNITQLRALGISAMSLFGGAASETITGNKAANVLSGGAGNDILWGGAGHDTLVGGAGNDRFMFKVAADSLVGTTADVITDFQDSGADRIDLSALWSGTFAWRGTGAFTGAHQVRVTALGEGDVLVQINLDADATAEMHIRLAHTTLASMAGSDFIL